MAIRPPSEPVLFIAIAPNHPSSSSIPGHQSIQMAAFIQLMHQKTRVTPWLDDLLHAHVVSPVDWVAWTENFKCLPSSVNLLIGVLLSSTLGREDDELQGAEELSEFILLKSLVTVLILKVEKLLDSQDPDFGVFFVTLHALGPCDGLLIFFNR